MEKKSIPLLRTCVKCGLPETYETIEFDQAGVCNICRQHEFKNKKIDWTARKGELDKLIALYRDKGDYDCMVPYSGGKDSTFTLWYLVTHYRLKPLVVQFNHGFMRENLRQNNERTFKKLGVDVTSFTPNWKLVKRVMLESLIRKGDFCWHCHAGIFAYPMHLAIKLNVPLIIWGEPSSEYNAYYDYRDDKIEEVDEERFNRHVNIGITAEDMKGMIEHDFDLDPRDLIPYTYPPIRELKRIRCSSVCLGSYIPWDTKKQSQIIQKELGWHGDEVEGMPWHLFPYEKIECYMQGMRDYIKWLKRGYSRVSQMTALDIRNGRMTSEEQRKLVGEYEGHKPSSLPIFLDYLGLTEDEFHTIVAKTVVPPWRPPDYRTIQWARKPHDFQDWYRELPENQGVASKADIPELPKVKE